MLYVLWRQTPRARGRPPGTGTRDEPILYNIALLRAADPTLEITSAIRQVDHLVADKNTNHARRIRMKYEDFEPMHGSVAHQYRMAEPYDPVLHSDAPIGARARVKQDSPLWAEASRNGWHPVQGWIDGEWIIQRQLCRLLTPQELHEQCAEYFAQIGPILQRDDEGR